MSLKLRSEHKNIMSQLSGDIMFSPFNSPQPTFSLPHSSVCLCSDGKRGTVAEKVANKSFKDFGLRGMLSDRVILGTGSVYQTREMPCWV